MKKLLTLSLLRRDGQILLGMKKKGFGEGWWNGFGGKVEPDEEIESAAKREIKEEIGIDTVSLEERGVIRFHFQGDPEILEVHIFDVLEFRGEPQETEEMKPQWFNREKIPYEQMWPADAEWMPIFFEGKKFEGDIFFDKDKNVLSCKISEVNAQEIEKEN